MFCFCSTNQFNTYCRRASRDIGFVKESSDIKLQIMEKVKELKKTRYIASSGNGLCCVCSLIDVKVLHSYIDYR